MMSLPSREERRCAACSKKLDPFAARNAEFCPAEACQQAARRRRYERLKERRKKNGLR